MANKTGFKGFKGFKVVSTIFKLVFEGEAYEGLEVQAKSLPLRDFLALQGQDEGEAGLKVIDKFGDALVSWNLEDEEGNLIPANADGLGSLEFSFVKILLDAWMEAVASVPNLSRPVSNDGGTSQELSIPMELL